MADGTDPSAYDRLRTIANTVSFVGAAIVLLIVLGGGCALAVAHALTRRTLIDLGVSTARRARLYARWTAVLPLTILATVPLALVLASQGITASGSFGLSWLLPAVSSSLASLVVGYAMLRAPVQVDE